MRGRRVTGVGVRRRLLDEGAAQHLLQRGVERAVGQHPPPAEHQVQPLAQLVAVHGSLVQQSEDCQLDGLCPTCHATYRSDISGMYANLAERRASPGERVGRPRGLRTSPARRAYPADSRDAASAGRCLDESTLEARARPKSPASAKKRSSKPTKKPQTRARAGAGVRAKWLLVVGLVCVLLGVGGFVGAYQAIDVPDPNEDFETQTSFVYYDRRGDRARHVRHPEPRVDPARRDAGDDQGRRGRRGEPDASGPTRASTPRASSARPSATPRATRPRAPRRSPSSTSRSSTSPRSRPSRARSRRPSSRSSCSAQLTKEQILEGYLNTIYFGRGAYGVQAAAKAYFDKDAKELTLRESAVLASVLNNPNEPRPGQRQGGHARSSRGATATCSTAWPRRARSAPTRPSRPRASCRSSPRSRPRASTAASGPHADDGARRAAPAERRLRRGRDRRRRAAGHHHVHQEGDGRRRAGRRSRPGPRASATRSSTSGSPASSPAPARCAASTAARTTSSPRSTGRSRAARRARR